MKGEFPIIGTNWLSSTEKHNADMQWFLAFLAQLYEKEEIRDVKSADHPVYSNGRLALLLFQKGHYANMKRSRPVAAGRDQALGARNTLCAF
jgi:hypothetical protein